MYIMSGKLNGWACQSMGNTISLHDEPCGPEELQSVLLCHGYVVTRLCYLKGG